MSYDYQLDKDGYIIYELTCLDCKTQWISNPNQEKETCPECESDMYTVQPALVNDLKSTQLA